MSSTYSTASFPGHDFGANMCIDGQTGSATGTWNFCMGTLNEANPWLSLTLPQGSVVASVDVYNRADCCQQYLDAFEVWVGSAAGYPSSSAGVAQCGTFLAPAEVGPFTVMCSTPLSGSVVTMLLPGTSRFLVVAEVT
eukprot:7380343-Prymnesium_polylepis.1